MAVENGTKRNIVLGAAALIIGTAAVASAGLGSSGEEFTLISATDSTSATSVSTTYATTAAYYSEAATQVSFAELSAPAAEEHASEESSVIYPQYSVTVYVSASGKYHARPNCSGMKSSTAMDISQASSEGHAPCRKCFSSLSEESSEPSEQRAETPPVTSGDDIVYVSASGKYHARSDCSGMKHYTAMDRASANAAGHEPCKKCY